MSKIVLQNGEFTEEMREKYESIFKQYVRVAKSTKILFNNYPGTRDSLRDLLRGMDPMHPVRMVVLGLPQVPARAPLYNLGLWDNPLEYFENWNYDLWDFGKWFDENYEYSEEKITLSLTMTPEQWSVLRHVVGRTNGDWLYPLYKHLAEDDRIPEAVSSLQTVNLVGADVRFLNA